MSCPAENKSKRQLVAALNPMQKLAIPSESDNMRVNTWIATTADELVLPTIIHKWFKPVRICPTTGAR